MILLYVQTTCLKQIDCVEGNIFYSSRKLELSVIQIHTFVLLCLFFISLRISNS